MGSDIKTTDLTHKATPIGPDLFMIVDSEDTTMAPSGTNKKSLFTDVAAAISALLGLGSAATKNATGAAPAVASVIAPVTVGHIATFADAAGTVQDGGPVAAAPAPVQPNTVQAGPAGGGAALPFFRLLTPPDIPMIPQAGVTNLVGDLAAIDAAINTLALDSAVLHKSANLSDVASIPTARNNLGLGSAATRAATGATPSVASVSGTITPGNVAIFADAAGTIADGGTGNPEAAPQPAHAVLAGPASGAAALPGFRALQAADVPPIPESGVINLVTDLNNLAAGVSASALDSAVLHKTSNLSDVASVQTTRNNLGLGTAAVMPASLATAPAVAAVAGPVTVGHLATFADAAGTVQDGGPASPGANPTPAHTILAGPLSGGPALPLFRTLDATDIPMIPESGVTGLVADLAAIETAINASALDAAVLHKSANLSDVANVATARTNLGLVASATVDTTNAGNISSGTLAAGRLPALTGDVTTQPGTVATSLAPTAVTPGSYTNANITVDGKGRIVAAASGTGGGTAGALLAANNLSDLANVVTARTNLGLAASVTVDTTNASNLASGTVAPARMPALTGDVTTTAGAVATTLAATAVTPGSYTYASITVDAKGRITAAASGTAPGATPPAGGNGQVQFNISGAFGVVPGISSSSNNMFWIVAQTAAQIPLVLQASANQTANVQEWHGPGGGLVTNIDKFGRLEFAQPNTATIAPGPGAGAGATCSVTGNEIAGIIVVNTGSTQAVGVVCTVTFKNPLSGAPCNIMLSPLNRSASAAFTAIYADWSTITANGFSVQGPATTGLLTGATYLWAYRVHI